MLDKLFGFKKSDRENIKIENKKKLNRFLVIGIGQLGESLVRHLYSDGLEVVALDTDAEHIESIKNHCNLAVTGDCMDINVLKQIGADQVDCAILCMGTSLEATVMAIAHLVELKVSHIAVRASNHKLAKIFERVGAHEVFFVEEQMGRILAHGFSRPAVHHSLDLGHDLHLIEWSPASWAIGQSLKTLDFAQKHRVQIVALRDKSKPKEILTAHPEAILNENTLALVVGTNECLDKLQKIEV